MKTLLTLFFLLTASVTTAYADILLGAPGISIGSRIATKVPFQIDYTLSNSYRFIFYGIQAKGDTLGAQGYSGITGNGGQFHLKASVSSSAKEFEKAGLLEFRNIQDFNLSPIQTLLIYPAAVFQSSDHPIEIVLKWSGEGNAHKPNGVFNILGEYQKDPPIPTGSIIFNLGNLAIEGESNPEASIKVIRD
jgi:hypothetical protein